MGTLPAVGDIGDSGGFISYMDGSGDFLTDSGEFIDSSGGFDPQGDNVVSLDGPGDGTFELAQYVPEIGPDMSPDGILRMLDRLSQLPTTVADQLWPYVQQLQQMLIDPNSIETHHLLPEQFKTFFEAAGFIINDPQFLLPMTAGDHRLKPDGIHTGPFKDSWNGQWEKWIENNPMDGLSQADKNRLIRQQLEVMKQQFPILQKYLPK